MTLTGQGGAQGDTGLLARVVEAGHRGDTGEARNALGSPDAAVRAAALGALRRAGDLQADDLVRALADPAPPVRRRAAEELVASSQSDPGAVPSSVSLLSLLDDDDISVVETAAWALGERAPAEDGAVERLSILVTDHDDALVREAAVAALGAIGDAAGLPAVLRATRDKATVRRRAVLALAPFDGAEVDEALARASEDRDWQVRQAAEDLGQ